MHFQETARIMQGACPNVRRLQRNIPATPAEEALEKGRLAGLPGPGQHHGGKLGGGPLEDRLQRTFYVVSHALNRLTWALRVSGSSLSNELFAKDSS